MKRITVLMTLVLLAGSVPVVNASTEAVQMCVNNYENKGGKFSGDSLIICDFPSSLKVANLATHSEGLHNGCSSGLIGGGTWNDCISSIDYDGLPANYRIQWYRDANYVNPLVCKDTNGDLFPYYDFRGANDAVSSFRVEGGNC